MDSYITVEKAAHTEIVIQKSRFLGFSIPCEKEEEALAFLSSLREQYRDASHCCYAYIIGTNGGIMRYSDDGEPGGTAGLPMIEFLKRRKLVNCCAAVVRYFGGILLGTGGLVRAYSESCQSVIKASGIVCMERTQEYYCDIAYSLWDTFKYTAQHLTVQIKEIEYGASVSFHLYIKKAEQDKYLPALINSVNRQLEFMEVGEFFMPWPSAETDNP